MGTGSEVGTQNVPQAFGAGRERKHELQYGERTGMDKRNLEFEALVADPFSEAEISRPFGSSFALVGGRRGQHAITERARILEQVYRGGGLQKASLEASQKSGAMQSFEGPQESGGLQRTGFEAAKRWGGGCRGEGAMGGGQGPAGGGEMGHSQGRLGSGSTVAQRGWRLESREAPFGTEQGGATEGVQRWDSGSGPEVMRSDGGGYEVGAAESARTMEGRGRAKRRTEESHEEVTRLLN
jgi:hypothetical protein